MRNYLLDRYLCATLFADYRILTEYLCNSYLCFKSFCWMEGEKCT